MATIGTSKQAQGEELIELFRGFLGILHGAIDFADWIALLAYAVWLDFLFHAQYTEEDLAKLEMLRQDMKSKMLGSQLFLKSKYVIWVVGCWAADRLVYILGMVLAWSSAAVVQPCGMLWMVLPALVAKPAPCQDQIQPAGVARCGGPHVSAAAELGPECMPVGECRMKNMLQGCRLAYKGVSPPNTTTLTAVLQGGGEGAQDHPEELARQGQPWQNNGQAAVRCLDHAEQQMPETCHCSCSCPSTPLHVRAQSARPRKVII